ncbi:hypothetical protein LAG90_03315 [Marinilongibacter aquaticus]|uniref:DUF6588 family protein n=1 Tax=Marinilongibacter aquaticus TaxID=2975157 RepID=UPI0021BD6CDA|nr:DUF6588 family protein [Marinilongibacter aquaticus]UBM59678.1 hypothetical protein LAG90_03315 [Marinilongibacter aquaticus]
MKKLILTVPFLYLSSILHAQLVDDVLNFYSGTEQEAYFSPVADIMTSASHAGLVDRMPLEEGFHLSFKIVTSASFVFGDQLKYFNPEEDDNYNYPANFQAPTFLGPAETVFVQNEENGTAKAHSPGLGTRYLTSGVPQLTIGNFAQTSVALRGLIVPIKSADGSLTWLGGTIQHNLGQYFIESADWGLVLALSYQQVKLKNHFDFSSQHVQLRFGKQKEKFHYQAFLAYQNGKLNTDFEYEKNGGGQDKFINSYTNNNKLAGGIGAGLNLSGFTLNSDITFLNPTVVSAQLGFMIGK